MKTEQTTFRAKDRTLNLCDFCERRFPECEIDVDTIEYGIGVGCDNIVGCPLFVEDIYGFDKIEVTEEPLDLSVCGAVEL